MKKTNLLLVSLLGVLVLSCNQVKEDAKNELEGVLKQTKMFRKSLTS